MDTIKIDVQLSKEALIELALGNQLNLAVDKQDNLDYQIIISLTPDK